MEGKVKGEGQCTFFRRDGEGEGRLENRMGRKRSAYSSSSAGGAVTHPFKRNGLPSSASQNNDDPTANYELESPSSRSPSTWRTTSPLLQTILPRCHHRRILSVAAPPSLLLSFGCFRLLLLVCFLGGGVRAMSTDYYHVDNGGGGISAKDSRITCYTCVNVSNNDECNRFAIDRPCPEGGDHCLTLHVMDAVDRERSVLVNKRCASLDDCSGDATGCTTAYGQTQCVSCCDQPYCNDSVPSNSTNAIFYRSAASAVVAEKRQWDIALRAATALMLPVLNVFMLGGHS